jgi:hypothetical protein
MPLAVIQREAFLPHATLDLDVIQKADSIAARASRIRRIAQPSATDNARKSAKDELRALIREARSLVVLL